MNLGYVIIAPNQPQAQLVDFHFPADPQLAQSFWQQVIDILRWRWIKMIETCFAAAYPEQTSLQALGFQPQPRPNTIIPVFRSFHSDLETSWLDAHFYYSMADSDLY